MGGICLRRIGQDDLSLCWWREQGCLSLKCNEKRHSEFECICLGRAVDCGAGGHYAPNDHEASGVEVGLLPEPSVSSVRGILKAQRIWARRKLKLTKELWSECSIMYRPSLP